jgi:CzcA family heavy metal efflux pump
MILEKNLDPVNRHGMLRLTKGILTLPVLGSMCSLKGGSRMFRGFIESGLNLRFLIVILAVVAILAGAAQLHQMPVDVLPEFSLPYVEIRTEALGLSAEEVEQLITTPMEQDLLAGVPWLDTIHSKSVEGLSSIVLVFEPGTDVIRARQMVGERLAQAFALPHVSKPPTMIQPLSSTSRFIIVGLSSEQLSLIQLSVLARWTIGPRLMGVPGVANVAIWGNRDRQLQVLVDPEQLKENDLSLLQILETTGNALWVSSLSFLEASTPGTGGFIDTPQQRLGIWHLSPLVSAEDLAQVPIEGAENLRLGQVTKVVEDHQPLIGDAVLDEKPGLLLVVEKFPGTNTRDVTLGVEDALRAMLPGLPGVKIDSSIFRPAGFIEDSIANIGNALIIGFLLLVMLLGFFAGWRAAIVGGVSIFLSLIAAAWVLYQRGTTMNIIVLAGLLASLGVVIDDAIIDIDTIQRRVRELGDGWNIEAALNIVAGAAAESRGAMIYATLIIIIAATPIFFLSGLAASFFQSLGFTYILTVLVSMIVALLVTPAMCMILMPKARSSNRISSFAERLQQTYRRTLGQVVQHVRPLMLVLIVGTLISVAGFAFLNRSMIPTFKDRNLLIQLSGVAGMSHLEMSRMDARISNELKSIPGVANVDAHMGRAIFGDQVVNVNSSEVWLTIDRQADYDKTVAAIQDAINGYPGLNGKVLTYMQDRTSELTAAGENTVNVRIYGDRQDILRNEANKVKEALTGLNGISNLKVDFPIVEPTLQIEVNLEKAQQYGIKPGEVRRTAAILLSGVMVGNLFEEQKVFDVVVWGTPDTRNSLSSINEMLVETPSGERVRLGDIADVRIVAVPSTIEHDAVKRYLDVIVSVKGRNIPAVVADIRGRLATMQFPLEYHAEILTSFTGQQVVSSRFYIFTAAAILMIFLLLQAAYRSWRLAFVSFITVPSALVGGVLLLFVTHGSFSLGSLIGFLVLLEIVVRNSIGMIEGIYRLERDEDLSFDQELIIRGAGDRLSSILATATAVALVLIPSLILGDIPGLETIRPMAVVVLGGLVTTTLLNLFVLPSLYLRYGASRERDLEILPSTTVDVPASAD